MLYDIIVPLAREVTGNKLSVTAERLLVVDLVNRAAKELYDSADLVGCLREQVFSAALTGSQVTLPYYVEHIRGVRPYSGFYPITPINMLPRYVSTVWEDTKYNWRVKYKTPLETNLTVASHLTFTLKSTESTDVIIYVTGSTPTSDRLTESVTITAGSLSATSTNVFTEFPGVKGLRKNRITTHNIDVYNDSSAIIATIPNCELESRNTIIQVVDSTGCCSTSPNTCTSDCTCWEILYKLRFVPFVNDFDEFPCMGYDDAIQWKARELWYADQDGKEERALLANQKCKSLVEQMDADAKKGIIHKISSGVSRFQNLHQYDNNYYPYYPSSPLNTCCY